MRIAMAVEYDGANFFGWQMQKQSDNTVQFAVEKAISTVANQPLTVICAGRTDSGVHGNGQIIHFDTDVQRTPRQWVYGSNVNLPKSVCILWAQEVREDFHARFSAQNRRYQYVIINRPVRPTHLQGRTTWEYRPLDVGRMSEAAQYLLGEHDFTSYRAQACQAKSPVRTIHDLTITRRGQFVIIDIEANAFLHHMVRNIAGVMMDIGAGKREPIWAKEILDHQDRKLGGVTAAPFGLYLNKVGYPAEFDLPQLEPTSTVW